MELLAPAGGVAALKAAVQSGADAVYLGVDAFGARRGAENFRLDELEKWVSYCHLYNVDVHVTVNTLIKNKELAPFEDCIRRLSEARVDALIVQDLGAAELIKATAPDMTLHASTQMTVTSLEGVKYLEKLGFSRVVLARELSRDEIGYICNNTDMEIEVFVHGAICMCYSGQCLMSSILGGRSGNRGSCAQPCRLPYELTENSSTVGRGYLLSPKDMALINDLGTLKKLGVRSLKIEGRLKRPEYVSTVVGIYRKYLDSGTEVTRDDMKALTDAFSRSGFTDGYFKNELGKKMMSHQNPANSADNVFTAEALARASEDANVRKIPTEIIGTLKIDEPLRVEMRDFDKHAVTAKGTLNAEAAVNKPLDDKRLCEQLMKLGQTPFECVNASVYADEGITIPIKEINAVRRSAADMLIKARSERSRGRVLDAPLLKRVNRESADIMLTCEVTDTEQLRAAIEKGIKRIYAPLGTLKNNELAAAAMRRGTELVTRTDDIFKKDEPLTDAVTVSSPAAIHYYKGRRLYGDFRLNVFNSRTANHFSSLSSVTLSPELNIREIRDLLEYTSVNAELIAYGHLPLMIMKNCPVKAMGRCQKGKRVYALRDRKNEEHPIMCTGDCRAELLNSKPLYLADKLEDLLSLKINSIRLLFTVENFSQCGKIIDEYKRALSGKTVNAPRENTFTRGHLYRGVL